MSDAPPATPAPPVDWPAVFAWMKANGAGYKKAAAHFGLPLDTVKSRVIRDRRKGEAPPVEPAAPKAAAKPWTAPFAKHAPPKDPHPAALTPEAVRALGPLVHRDIRDTIEGLTMAGAAVKRRMLEYLEVETERAAMRAAGKSWLDINEDCPLPEMPDTRRTDSGVRALAGLAQFVPHIGALDEATGGASADTGPTKEEREAVHAALAPVGAPKLTLVAPLVGRGDGG